MYLHVPESYLPQLVVSLIKVSEDLPVCFQAFALCTMHPMEKWKTGINLKRSIILVSITCISQKNKFTEKIRVNPSKLTPVHVLVTYVTLVRKGQMMKMMMVTITMTVNTMMEMIMMMTTTNSTCTCMYISHVSPGRAEQFIYILSKLLLTTHVHTCKYWDNCHISCA